MVGEGVQKVSVLNFKLDGRCMLSYIPFSYNSVKSLPAMWENQVRSLGQEDPLEKGMATHSSILAWRIPWTVEK